MSIKLEMKDAQGGRPGGNLPPEIIHGPRQGARTVWVEIPAQDQGAVAWCYTDRRSYQAGDTVDLHVSATVGKVKIRIFRDGASPETVAVVGPLACEFHPINAHVYETGCDWPVLFYWKTSKDLRPGAYLIEILDAAAEGVILGHHLVIIRANRSIGRADIVLVAATSTWAAYNDWGGASHYYGIHHGTPRGRSPILSSRRPWARGQIWLPQDAPRAVNARRPTTPGPARYECIEWAFIHGYSKYYAYAGWASYERPFIVWAEGKGFNVDIVTQDDLHEDVDTLNGYRCAIFVGHDEYWSREMRQAVEHYVEKGGHVARFAGNFLWQIRLEKNCERQIAYKYDARSHDPLATTQDAHLMTGAWEDPIVNYPGAITFGVNSLRGIYAGFGGMARRAPRGFLVFRPDHWAFANTGLAYADMFGDEASIFGFEMDGIEYTFQDGLPVPTHGDGAPKGLQILAMGWATLAESGRPEDEWSLMLGDGDARFKNFLLSSDSSEEAIKRDSRGSGMIVTFKRGYGEVFTAATCEWVNGLIEKDYYTESITMNILNKFLSG